MNFKCKKHYELRRKTMHQLFEEGYSIAEIGRMVNVAYNYAFKVINDYRIEKWSMT